MKKTVFIFILMLSSVCFAQDAFHNFGDVQIHAKGAIGFHTNLVNDGTFDQNLGLAGFYNVDGSLEILGENKPVFSDVEVEVVDDLYLNVSVGVKNNLSFISGKVITPRDNLNVSLEFINHFVYSGEGDYDHVDGYVTSTNLGEFIFPIGDANALRPMLLANQTENSTFKGAYFKENPNNPYTFNNSFNTSNKQNLLHKINEAEFWDLDGVTETEVVLTWNSESNIALLTNNIESLRVVGWDKAANKWVDLGGKNVSGDVNNGSVQSVKFIPNNYEIITIGTDFNFVLGIESNYNQNYAFSPNGDGVNDYLVIEGIELRPNNTLKILNRWGALVYSKRSYNNTWNGISEHSFTIDNNVGLPTGSYFYILDFDDDNITWTGYIYLKR